MLFIFLNYTTSTKRTEEMYTCTQTRPHNAKFTP